MSLIRDYIAYAKENINPVLTEEASQNLIDKYVSMRKVMINNRLAPQMHSKN